MRNGVRPDPSEGWRHDRDSTVPVHASANNSQTWMTNRGAKPDVVEPCAAPRVPGPQTVVCERGDVPQTPDEEP